MRGSYRAARQHNSYTVGRLRLSSTLYPYIQPNPPVGPFHHDWPHMTSSLITCLKLLLSGLLFLPFACALLSTFFTRSLRWASHIDKRSKGRELKSLCIIVYIRLSASSKATEAPIPASGDMACAASPMRITRPLGLCQCSSSGTSKNLLSWLIGFLCHINGQYRFLRVAVKILLGLFPHDLADVRRPVVATKPLDKHLLLFISPGHKVIPISSVMIWKWEC